MKPKLFALFTLVLILALTLSGIVIAQEPTRLDRSPASQGSPEQAVAASSIPTSMPARAPVVLLAGHGTAPFRVPPPRPPAPQGVQSATFNVNYLAWGAVNIWGDTCLAWPTGAQTAFTYAVSIWASLLNSSVPITINACWATLGSGVLGHGGADGYYRDFPGAVAGTWYAVALANALSGTDINDTTAEMDLAYSNGINWYFDTDGHPEMSQYDFVSVVLHEVAHGLGFSGSMNWDDGNGANGTECNGTSGVGCWGLSTGYPVIYDRFAQDNSGVSLLNTIPYPNASAALAGALQSQNVYFYGTNANAANSGQRVKLYAPATWNPGSSFSHLDEMFDGTANALMTYSLNNGEAVHDPGPVTSGILKDVGWSMGQLAPDVGLVKQMVGQNLQPGDLITFTLTFSNSGNATASNVVVTDIVPAQVQAPSFASTILVTQTGVLTYAWNVKPLGIGEGGVISVYGQINPSWVVTSVIWNTATISSPQDSTPANNTSTVMVGGYKVYLPLTLKNY